MLFQETEKTELKKVFTETLSKEIVAFLNSFDGIVYIGINDDGSVLGVDDLDETQKKIADIVTTQILPNPQDYIELGTKYVQGKNVVEIKVNKGNGLYYIKKYGRSAAGCFIRMGTSCRSMTEEQIEQRFLAGMRHEEKNISEIPVLRDDYTFNILKQALVSNGIHINEESFLKNFRLITSDGKYNILADILADVNMNSVKVAVFDGTDKSVFLKRNEYGFTCLLESLQKVISYCDALNETYIDVSVRPRKETRMFCPDAFREAWINACVHNNWSKGVAPSVYWYADRLEIVSYGGIPENLSKEDFLAGKTAPVNIDLMKIFLQCGIVEQSGHGVPIVVREYGEEAYSFSPKMITVTLPFKKKPVSAIPKKDMSVAVNERENEMPDKNATVNATVNKIPDENATVNATVNATENENSDENATANATVNATENDILSILSELPTVTAEELSRRLHMHRTTVFRYLSKLKEKGLIVRIGSDKSGRWAVVRKK